MKKLLASLILVFSLVAFAAPVFAYLGHRCLTCGAPIIISKDLDVKAVEVCDERGRYLYTQKLVLTEYTCVNLHTFRQCGVVSFK